MRNVLFLLTHTMQRENYARCPWPLSYGSVPIWIRTQETGPSTLETPK